MNEVLLYLLRNKMPLLDPAKLPQLLKLNRQEWTNYVDDFRGMIVTCPGMVGLLNIANFGVKSTPLIHVL